MIIIQTIYYIAQINKKVYNYANLILVLDPNKDKKIQGMNELNNAD